MVFVLDRHKHPLMPCSPKRARLLLTRGRAVVHRLKPFVIRLKDRTQEESTLQGVVLKLDPGSKTTGMALARVEASSDGEVHHALSRRARYRRRRRSANLRHRPSRFTNRRRPPGWLPPSLRSRVGNVLTWARRYCRWVPLTRMEVERVKFDTQLLQNPDITGLEYQRGELTGWEIRAYVLEKFHHHCAYCHCGDVPFELDHQIPRSRGGSNRVSNLVLSCQSCNLAKGNWTGGRTRLNRARFGIEKAHSLDALCVGDVAGIRLPALRTLAIRAQGRGSYQRTNVDESGFLRGYLTRQKRIHGFSTGDLVRACVPAHLKTGGIHLERVAVRASGSFRVGRIDGINAKYCRVVQRADGYNYAFH